MIRITHTVHAVLFADFFGAAARIAPFDLAFVVELSGYWAGVGIGAEKEDGITSGAFVIAETLLHFPWMGSSSPAQQR